MTASDRSTISTHSVLFTKTSLISSPPSFYFYLYISSISLTNTCPRRFCPSRALIESDTTHLPNSTVRGLVSRLYKAHSEFQSGSGEGPSERYTRAGRRERPERVASFASARPSRFPIVFHFIVLERIVPPASVSLVQSGHFSPHLLTVPRGMAPSIRLSRSRGSTSNLASPANSSPAPAPGDLSRRSSGRAAAARIYETTQQLARYADEEDDDEDDDEEDDEDAEGEEDDEGLGAAATPSRAAGGSRRASSGRAAAARGRGQSSGTTVRLRGRPPGRAAAVHSRLPFPQADDDDDDEDEDEDEEDEEDEPMPEATPSASRGRGRPRGRGAASRGTPRGRGRGARGRPSISSARKVSEDEEDGDESRSHAGEEEEERPAFKKRPSRLQGFSLVLDNSQTLLGRIPNPDPTADDKGRRGRGGPRGRGRPRKNKSQTTRIIEDSEDEDSDDDRPRPKDPNAVEVDDDHAVPPDEKFKVKLMGKEYILDCDELELPGDEEGDKKIDANGNLLGGE